MTWKPTSACMENLTMAGCIDPRAQGLAGPVQWANPWRTANGTRPHPVNDTVLGRRGLSLKMLVFIVCLMGGAGAGKSGFHPFGKKKLEQICISGEFVTTSGEGTLPTTAINPPSCVKSGCHVCTVYIFNKCQVSTMHPDLHWTGTILQLITFHYPRLAIMVSCTTYLDLTVDFHFALQISKQCLYLRTLKLPALYLKSRVGHPSTHPPLLER